MKVPYEVRKLLYADPDISDAAKTLFTVLAGFTKGGITDCDLPNETITKAAGMLRRSAERPYAELRRLGWIAYAEVRGSYRKIALMTPQNCVVTIRKSAYAYKEVPVKNLILTSNKPEPLSRPSKSNGREKSPPDPRHMEFRSYYFAMYQIKYAGVPAVPWDEVDASQLALILKKNPSFDIPTLKQLFMNWWESDNTNRTLKPAKWLPRLPEYASGPQDIYGRPMKELRLL